MATETMEYAGEKCFDRFWNGKAQCRVENEWILPDYKEAAQRLIRVDVDPRVTAENLFVKGQEYVCEVEGAAFIQALYLPEGDGWEESVASFSSKESFFYTFHVPFPGTAVPDPAEVVILCEAAAENVNVRLLGPRRIAARCDVALTLDLEGNREITCFSGAVPEDAEIRDAQGDTTILAAVIRRDMELRETLTLPPSYLPIREMTDISFSLFADRVKTTDGSVDFTGHLVLNASYAPEGETGVISFCQPLEFEKSVGSGDAMEGDLCEVTLTPVNIQTAVEMSEGGENKNLSLEVDYTAEIRLYRRKNFRYLTDLYSVKNEMELSIGREKVRSLIAVRDFTRDLRLELPLRHAPFRRAEDVRAEIEFRDTVREGKQLYALAQLRIKYLALGENGAFFAAEDNGEVKLELPVGAELPEEDGVVEITGGVSDALVLLREDVVEARFGVYGRVTLARETVLDCVTGIERGEALPPVTPGLLFYYPDETETLWDVCKKHHVRVSEVRRDATGEGTPEVVRMILH